MKRLIRGAMLIASHFRFVGMGLAILVCSAISATAAPVTWTVNSPTITGYFVYDADTGNTTISAQLSGDGYSYPIAGSVYVTQASNGIPGQTDLSFPTGFNPKLAQLQLATNGVLTDAGGTYSLLAYGSSGQYTGSYVCVADANAVCTTVIPVTGTVTSNPQMCRAPAVPVPASGKSWSQADSGWGGNHYDNANPPKNTIAAQGCNLTALAYAMSAAGHAIDPGALNTVLDGVTGAYSAPQGNMPNSGGRIAEGTAIIRASNGALKFDSTNSGTATPAALNGNLCAATPRPVIVRVPSSGVSGMHFVIVTGQKGSSYSIVDPGHRNITDISAYGGLSNAQIVGVVKPPVGNDPGELDFSILDNATLLVTAPDGSRTGLDTTSGKVLKGAPGSAYQTSDNSIDTDTDSEAATETMYSVQTFLPADGIYTVTVEGLQLGPFNLVIQALDVNGNQLTHLSLPGIANIGSTATYQVKFAAAPGSNNTVVSMTTFASALADVANGFNAGLITKQPIEEVLTDLLKIARDASYRHDRWANELERVALGVFRQVIIAETNKQITGIEPQVLLNDARSLTSQIPSDSNY
jgi:hypothetical protein